MSFAFLKKMWWGKKLDFYKGILWIDLTEKQVSRVLFLIYFTPSAFKLKITSLGKNSSTAPPPIWTHLNNINNNATSC